MNLAVLIDLNAAVIFIAVALFVNHRRPPAPLWPTLYVVQLAALLWIAGDLGSLLAKDLFWEQASISLIYAGSFGMFASWWVLAFRFAKTHGVEPTWATPAVVWGPAVFGLFTWLCATTNPIHGQFLTPVIGGRNDYHWLWWATAPVGYILMGCIAAGYWTLCRRLKEIPRSLRQARTMLVATLLGLASNTAYTLLPIEWPLDISIAGGLVTGLIFVIGIYQGTLFDLSPAALLQLLNNDPTPLLLVNPNGELLYANAKAHALFEPVQLTPNCSVEAKFRKVFRQENLSENPFSIRRIWDERDNQDYAAAFSRTSDDSNQSHLWVTGQGVGGPGSKTEALSIRIHDTSRIYNLESSKRLVERRLAQTDRLRSLGSMAAGIAHEVNNPIGSALIAAEFALEILDETDDPEAYKTLSKETLQTVVEQNRRAARVTRSMLRFARVGSGERKFGDIGLITSRACQFTRELALIHGAVVDLKLNQDLPHAFFNPTEIEQVFVNLIHNAILSGKPGRHVSIVVEAIDSCLRITITDNGSGMTMEQCEQAFEPFHSSRSESIGTGLGLSVVHGIVTDHGGEVWLESEPGLGTSAIVQLPSTPVQLQT